MSKNAFHIPSLDGLRAVSFGIVFVAHAGLEKYVPGGFGVTVFFFLSGFLITTLMRTEFEKSGTVSLKAFYLRRVLRILPPFYFVLTVATVLTALLVLAGELNRQAVAAQFLHYANFWIVSHGYSGQALGTGVYWSLAVEEHFYFLFPWLYLLLRRLRASHRRQAVVLWSICGLILLWRCVLVFGLDAPTDRTYLASDTRFDSILFGAALAVWNNPVLDGDPKGSPALWKYVLLPLSIAVLLLGFLWRDDQFRETARYTLQGLALGPIFMVAIRWPQFLPFRLLNTKVVSFVGVLSYSLYLTHHVVIFGVHKYLPQLHGLVQGAIALALALTISYGIYLAIEKPCARLRKRLSA
ncbi:MAG: acyltransferase 3 [Myxococcaceae bacterium]|nr:acyltransferase 3 [Myxococcaceae bacterium]